MLAKSFGQDVQKKGQGEFLMGTQSCSPREADRRLMSYSTQGHIL